MNESLLYVSIKLQGKLVDRKSGSRLVELCILQKKKGKKSLLCQLCGHL